MGVDFLIKKKYIKSIDKEVEFMIWDTAGQECYDAITTRYYKGASGALIVFSVTDKDSFNSVKKWRDKKSSCSERSHQKLSFEATEQKHLQKNLLVIY